jgi:hypothetical protein
MAQKVPRTGADESPRTLSLVTRTDVEYLMDRVAKLEEQVRLLKQNNTRLDIKTNHQERVLRSMEKLNTEANHKIHNMAERLCALENAGVPGTTEIAAKTYKHTASSGEEDDPAAN